MKSVKCREMGPFVKADVLLVLYLKRKRKNRERKKEAEGMFCVAYQVFLKQLAQLQAS